MDFFQILVLASPEPYAQTIFSFLIFFFDFLSIPGIFHFRYHRTLSESKFQNATPPSNHF